ncbi:MAG TPA: class I SAM-dependent methyltransferase [Streptosporangiaceae bacterium]|nr:class I SAM-dependent methyltransferase [Streptosporangiaceae bacterium]
MARFSEPLAVQFADLAGVKPGGESIDGLVTQSQGDQRVLDVGCGPGALTAELVRRLGPGSVNAIDPSEPFVTAARQRLPEVEIRLASAEQLPFEDREFHVAMAQLVVQFMNDPAAGLREMARVTRPGGVVAACVWDRGGDRSPLSPFWQAVADLDQVEGEGLCPGVNQGDIARLFAQAGLAVVKDTELTVQVPQIGFDEWWEPVTLGVGPAGDYVLSLDAARRAQLRDHCQQILGEGPPVVSATVWAVTGTPRRPAG